MKSGQEIGSAEFVLAPRDGQDARQVKTVWTPDIQNYQDDTKLNKVMEFFRVAKVIDPKFTAQTLHPLYRDRKLKNFHSVSKEFEKIGLLVTSEQLENVEDDTLDKVQEKWKRPEGKQYQKRKMNWKLAAKRMRGQI